CRSRYNLELLLLRRAREGERRALPAADRAGDGVEVAGADLALVARRRVAELLQLELALLELDVRRHPLTSVAVRELEQRRIERVEAGQRDELEPVPELPEVVLEPCDRGVVERPLPVEGGRAVVGEQLAGEALVDRLRELARLAEVRRRRL